MTMFMLESSRTGARVLVELGSCSQGTCWVTSAVLLSKDHVTEGYDVVEVELYSQRAKLFHLRGNVWQPLGLIDAKLLRHAAFGFVRFSMYQENTMVVMGNFVPVGLGTLMCVLRLADSCVQCLKWEAFDVSKAGSAMKVLFKLWFVSSELALNFKPAFVEAKESNELTAVTLHEKKLSLLDLHLGVCLTADAV